MASIEELKRRFVDCFGGTEDGIRLFFAPGRVNLIGEHTDYNGGYVFPAALTLGTTMLVRKREGRTITFASENFELTAEVDMAETKHDHEHDWVNYPKAILAHLMLRGFSFQGYDVLYSGDLPNGAGLSSSASIQLATAYGFMGMEGHPLDRIELALIAQESENRYMGVQCGIMDQFTVAMGRKDHAILLKCSNLEYRLVPFKSDGYRLVIGNTNKRRGLLESEYNVRRAQCEQAVQILKTEFEDIKLLGELTLEQYERSERLIPDPTVRKRARHVVEENDRVLRSVAALENDDLVRFGELMNASHASLRDLYEVSCRELDVMVEEAQRARGVPGARMTGAGFGGCTVSLVRQDHVDEFIDKVGAAYTARTGFKGEFYAAEIGDGVKELEDERGK